MNSSSDIEGLRLIAPDSDADFNTGGSIDTFRFCELSSNE